MTAADQFIKPVLDQDPLDRHQTAQQLDAIHASLFRSRSTRAAARSTSLASVSTACRKPSSSAWVSRLLFLDREVFAHALRQFLASACAEVAQSAHETAELMRGRLTQQSLPSAVSISGFAMIQQVAEQVGGIRRARDADIAGAYQRLRIAGQQTQHGDWRAGQAGGGGSGRQSLYPAELS